MFLHFLLIILNLLFCKDGHFLLEIMGEEGVGAMFWEIKRRFCFSASQLWFAEFSTGLRVQQGGVGVGVCVCAHARVFVCARTWPCVSLRLYTCVYVCVCLWRFLTDVRAHSGACTRVWVCVSIYVYVCGGICIYIHTYMYAQPQRHTDTVNFTKYFALYFWN